MASALSAATPNGGISLRRVTSNAVYGPVPDHAYTQRPHYLGIACMRRTTAGGSPVDSRASIDPGRYRTCANRPTSRPLSLKRSAPIRVSIS
jgi:hypothetical protein